MKNEFLRRNYTFDIRAEKKEGDGNSGKYTLFGVPIVYNSRTDIGWFDEIIEQGALDKTDLKDVRFLVNHDLSKIPLARSRNNNANSTMRLKVTDKGLEVEIDLDADNNTDARNLYSAVTRGDITGMSFMFGVDGEEWEDLDSDHPTRRIKAISTVVEVSAVTFPAYEATEIYARDKTALDNAKIALDNARAAVDTANAKAKEKRELELLKEKAKLYY
jgi:HK97 family phage prohead protease